MLFLGPPITVGNVPIYMSINPEINRGYVSNYLGGVSVIDTASNTLATQIATGYLPVGSASEPRLGKLYVVNSGSSTLSVIQAQTNLILNTITIGCSEPLDVKLDTIAQKALVSKSGCSQLAVFETLHDSLVTTLPMPGKPQYIAVNSVTHRAYVTYNFFQGERGFVGGLAVVDTSANQIVKSLSFGKNPTRLALDSLQNRLYITDRDANSVFVVDTTTDTVVKQIGLAGGSNPVDLAIVPTPLPKLSVSTPSVSFEPQILGTTSSAQTVQVKNDGNAYLSIQSAAIAGAGFQFTKNTCGGVTLLPRSVCYLAMSFAPTTAGSYSATLTIVSNDLSSPKLIPITGVNETRLAVDIEAITPTVGQGGSAVLIRGRNFGARQGTSTVDIGGRSAVINSWSQHAIEAVAPDGLSGVVDLTVRTSRGTSNAVNFTYASADLSIWKRLKGGWTQACDGAFGTIAIHPANPRLIYIGSSPGGGLGCGIYASADEGKSWIPLGKGIPRTGASHYPAISRISIAPSNPKTIYFGTFVAESQTGRIFKSADAGSTWWDASGLISPILRLPTIHFPVLDIAVHPRDANIVYAAISGGIYKTTSAGQTWTQVVTGRPPTLGAAAIDNYIAVRIAPANPEILYAVGYTNHLGASISCSVTIGECTEINRALALPALKSSSGGRTWTPMTNPAPTAFLSQSLNALLSDIAVNPVSENGIVASTISHIAPVYVFPVITNNKGIFGSADGGTTWKPINGAAGSAVAESPILRLVNRTDQPNTLLALSRRYNTIFMTMDGGLTWEQLTSLGLEDQTSVLDAAFAGTKLYATTSHGIYVLDLQGNASITSR